jgi:hypothetical protein
MRKIRRLGFATLAASMLTGLTTFTLYLVAGQTATQVQVLLT